MLAPDGWLKTGDLVTENADGTYNFVGRKKEVIRRRGENVAPAEIEDALSSHPDVGGGRGGWECPPSSRRRRSRPSWWMRDGTADFEALRALGRRSG